MGSSLPTETDYGISLTEFSTNDFYETSPSSSSLPTETDYGISSTEFSTNEFYETSPSSSSLPTETDYGINLTDTSVTSSKSASQDMTSGLELGIISVGSTLGLNDTFVPSSITQTDFESNSTSSSQMPTDTNVMLEGTPSAVLTGANVTLNSTGQYACPKTGVIISIDQVCDGI